MLQIKVYKPTTHKIKCLIYGESWSGKTSFGWTAPNVIFASAEAGLLSVANKWVSYAEIKSIADLRELLGFLRWEHKFETVVLDSITEINDIIKAEIERKKWKPMQLQDWWVLAKDIEKILRAFRWLDMNVIMIAQEKIIDDDGKIAKIVPDLNWKAASKIAYFMDIVGHMEIQWDWTYLVNLSWDKWLVTKDRTGMLWTDTVPDFTKWLEALEDMEVVDVEEIIEEVWKKPEVKKEIKQEEIIEEEPKKVVKKTTIKATIEKEVDWKLVTDSVKEIDLFTRIYEDMKMTADETTLDEILSNLREDLKKDPDLLTKAQKTEIGSLKQDMIKSFTSKEEKMDEKRKVAAKKTTTKKVQTK